MGFLKTLFTGREETEEEKQEHEEKAQFDVFKYDGIQALRIGKVDYAIACFEHALDIKDDVETQQYYADALLRKGDIEGGTEAMESLLEMQPDDVQTILTLAELYYQQEQYDKMGEACAKALSIDDTLATPYFITAKQNKACGDLINAVANATIAISRHDEFKEAYMLRAQVLTDMQQYAEAENDVDHLLDQSKEEDESEDDELLLLKADICKALGKTDEAKDFYHKVIDINPYLTKAYMQLGDILRNEGNTKEAAEMVEEGLKYAPEELQSITGEYTNFEDKMREAFNAINPFQLSSNI